jgi:glutathione S-transferase
VIVVNDLGYTSKMSTKTAAIAVTTILTTKPMKPKFRYLSAWFCPYAHRATIALEYHQAHVDYVWVEALGWYQKTTKETKNDTDTNTNVDNNAPTTATAAATLNTPTPVNNNNNSSSNDNKDDDNTEWYYHWKAEELKRVNPSALVPTLVPIIRTPKAASSTTTTAEKTIAVEEKDEEMVEIVDESKAV